jgi:hypothetical protein
MTIYIYIDGGAIEHFKFAIAIILYAYARAMSCKANYKDCKYIYMEIKLMIIPVLIYSRFDLF